MTWIVAHLSLNPYLCGRAGKVIKEGMDLQRSHFDHQQAMGPPAVGDVERIRPNDFVAFQDARRESPQLPLAERGKWKYTARSVQRGHTTVECECYEAFWFSHALWKLLPTRKLSGGKCLSATQDVAVVAGRGWHGTKLAATMKWRERKNGRLLDVNSTNHEDGKKHSGGMVPPHSSRILVWRHCRDKSKGRLVVINRVIQY
jgi:hypothetical protein